jgi:hypothetical protein
MFSWGATLIAGLTRMRLINKALRVAHAAHRFLYSGAGAT